MLSAQPPGRLSAAVPPRPSREGEGFGIVAGGGRLPHLLAEAVEEAGWRAVVVAVSDGTKEDWSAYQATSFGWGRTGDIFPHFAVEGVRHAAFCGTISARPDYRFIWPSVRTLRLLPEIFRIVRGGDDSLLRAVGRAFERRGFLLHAVHEFLPELLTPSGLLTRTAPKSSDMEAMRRAADAARRLGEADVGQAAVASAERVIALEGIEGTREMLARVADLKTRGRIGRSERCVLFKSVKPQQDRRFDLPSIGVETLEQASAAGLVGIGLTAGASLLIGVEDIVARAEGHGIFLLGLEEERP